MTLRSLRLAAVVPLAALALTACSDEGDSASAEDGLTVVASTNVYGDIAEAVGGDLIEVQSIITSATQDPHEYEASARDRLAIDEASIVIKNGGGFDPFVDTLLESAGNDPVVLDAVEVSGLASEEEHEDEHADEHEDEHADEHADEHEDEHADEHEGHEHIEGFNEHVWYDFHAVEKLADELAAQLGELDPDNASSYEENAEAFGAAVEELEASAATLKTEANGRGVAITEPVPLYLLAEVGLVNQTPEDFSEAVEEGADVPPRVLQETLDLFADGDIALLAYNSQTADETTEKVRAAAEAEDVPVVDFTETLPDGQSYVEWQQANIDHLAEALGA